MDISSVPHHQNISSQFSKSSSQKMQQPPTNEMAPQGYITSQGLWCYRCRYCQLVFTSSQGLAGHQHKHMRQGLWIRGAPHHKFFCPSADFPSLKRLLGNRKSTPTVLRGQGRFYRPYPRETMVEGARNCLGSPRSIFNPSQQKMVRVPPRPRGYPRYSYNQPQQQQAMVQVRQRPPRGRMPCMQAMVQVSHRPRRGRMPHLAAAAPVTQEGLVACPANQLVPYGFQLNHLTTAMAVWRVELSTHSSIGSTSTVTTVTEDKNDDQEVEGLDLELRL